MNRLPLTETHLRRLAEYGLQDVPREACACLQFLPGETLFLEGEPIPWYSVVVSGRAKVCRIAPNGRTLTLCNYENDGMIGEIELMTNREITSTAVTAITEFTCVAINYEACRQELLHNTVFLHKIGCALAEKLLRSSDGFSSSALFSGEQRLCAYILQTSNRNVFSDILTDVASAIGVSYRHLFRLLQALCDAGALEKRANGYRILDAGELLRRSGTMEWTPKDGAE